MENDRTIPLEAEPDSANIAPYFGGREVKVKDDRVFDAAGGGEVLGHIRTTKGAPGGAAKELELTSRGRELVDEDVAGWE